MSKEMGPAFPVGNDDMWEAHEAVKAERDYLRAINAELLAALEGCADMLAGAIPHAPRIRDLLTRQLDATRAAIAKAKGEKR